MSPKRLGKTLRVTKKSRKAARRNCQVVCSTRTTSENSTFSSSSGEDLETFSNVFFTWVEVAVEWLPTKYWSHLVGLNNYPSMKCFRFCQVTWKHIWEGWWQRWGTRRPHRRRIAPVKSWQGFSSLINSKLVTTLNVQLTMVPTSPPIAKNAMLQRETKVPPIAWPVSGIVVKSEY